MSHQSPSTDWIKGMTLSVFPDLIVCTARVRASFDDIHRQLKDIPGGRFGLLYLTSLRIANDSLTKEFTSPEEAEAFAKTLNT